MSKEYNAKDYWNKRATESKIDIFRAVCAEGRDYLENLAMHNVQLSVLNSLTKDIELTGKQVMELGCGVGRWVPYILRRGADYVGIDISDVMVSVAKDRWESKGAKFYKLTNNRLPFEDESFDFVFSITVLHHNPFDQQSVLISEILRVLRKNGYFLLFEAISHDKPRQIWFNTWARPVRDWVDEVCKNSRCSVVGIKPVRYWIFKDFALKLLRGVSLSNLSNSYMITKLLLYVSCVIDRFLVSFLEIDKATGVAILFRKKST